MGNRKGTFFKRHRQGNLQKDLQGSTNGNLQGDTWRETCAGTCAETCQPHPCQEACRQSSRQIGVLMHAWVCLAYMAMSSFCRMLPADGQIVPNLSRFL